jgi:hypothetical protein
MAIFSAQTIRRITFSVPPTPDGVERQVRRELAAAKREGCRVLLLTGNHGGALRTFARFRHPWRGRWLVIPPEDRISAARKFGDELLPETASAVVASLVTEGMAGLLVALAKSVTKSGARALVGRRRPKTLDGVPPYMDEFLTYLRSYASSGPTIVTAELSGESANELIGALSIFVKSTPEIRGLRFSSSLG